MLKHFYVFPVLLGDLDLFLVESSYINGRMSWDQVSLDSVPGIIVMRLLFDVDLRHEKKTTRGPELGLVVGSCLDRLLD